VFLYLIDENTKTDIKEEILLENKEDVIYTIIGEYHYLRHIYI